MRTYRARGTQTKKVPNPDVSISKHCACCPASRVDVLSSQHGASLSLSFTAKALADARSAYYAVAASGSEKSKPEQEQEQLSSDMSTEDRHHSTVDQDDVAPNITVEAGDVDSTEEPLATTGISGVDDASLSRTQLPSSDPLASLHTAVIRSPEAGYSSPTKTTTWTRSQARPRVHSTPTGRVAYVSTDEEQQSQTEDADSEDLASGSVQVLKAGYLDKQLRRHHSPKSQLKPASPLANQDTSSDTDVVWKQRYVEIVVDTPSTTVYQELTATPSHARLIFRHSPGGRELGSVPLLPPAKGPAAVSMAGGTRITRASRPRQQRQHQHANAVWSIFTVESPAADGGSGRQVSFSALDHDAVSAWCAAVEQALETVGDGDSRQAQDSTVDGSVVSRVGLTGAEPEPELCTTVL